MNSINGIYFTQNKFAENFGFNNYKKEVGVIAQEVEQIFPSLVDTDGDNVKSVKFSVFVPMLIKALQELKAEFDAYKASHP